jgi:hypothetical protein
MSVFSCEADYEIHLLFKYKNRLGLLDVLYCKMCHTDYNVIED